jgi:uncharacterized protein YcbK (DUF882 family)
VTKLTEHFSKEEFDCQCGCGNGDIIISENLVFELECVRVHYGKPMRINSGIRCLSHNRKIGSRDTSSHIKGLAVDISCNNMGTRLKLVKHLLRDGEFTRIGFHREFIHVDIDYDKPKGIFLY